MKCLVTGGAGFIGSHLVDALVERGDEVLVLDDLFSGRTENVNPAARLITGSVTEADAVSSAVRGAQVVWHLAAHGAVARSVANPLATNRANVDGTLSILKAANDAGVERVVFASSSSVYGGITPPPTPETAPTYPRSPYAVTKLTGELYCRVFAELFPLETVALRFFNVYGPRQRPDSTYAAVIPRFTAALLTGEPPIVYGDGRQSRDFTYVADVVRALLAAASAPAEYCSGNVYNVAGGQTWSLLELLDTLGSTIGFAQDPEFAAARPGDIRVSMADAAAAARDLDFRTEVSLAEGLRNYVEWYRRSGSASRTT